jgi:hypothetical protein
LSVLRRKTYVLLAYLLLGLAAYSNVVNAFFLSDDFELIGRVLEGGLPFTWGREHGGFFRPVFILSFYLDGALWGSRPFGFHLTNLSLHSLDAFLVYLLTRELLRKGRAASTGREWKVALVAGLVFLLHPSHTEAVTWVSGRADLLASLFSLLSVLSFISHSGEAKTGALVKALMWFALALLSKESAACLPALVFAVGFYLDESTGTGTRFRRALMKAAPFFALLVFYVGARAFVLGTLVGGYGAARHLDFTHSLVASQLLRFSLRALLPSVVLSELPFLESRALSPVLIVTGSIVVLSAAALLRRRENRLALFAWARRHAFAWLMILLSACALLPVLALRINVFDTQGERFLYLPSAFFAPALAYLCLWTQGTVRRAKLRAATVVCLLVFYASSLWVTNRSWSEAARLSHDILRELTRQSERGAVLLLNAPDNLRGAYVYRNGLGQALLSFQQEKRFNELHVAAWHSLRETTDRMELSEDGGTYALRPSGEATKFERAGSTPGCARDMSLAENLLRIRLEGCGGTFDVFYLSEGKIKRVEILQSP